MPRPYLLALLLCCLLALPVVGQVADSSDVDAGWSARPLPEPADPAIYLGPVRQIVLGPEQQVFVVSLLNGEAAKSSPKGVAHWTGQRWEEFGRLPAGLPLSPGALTPGGEMLLDLSEGHFYGPGSPTTTVWRCRNGYWRRLGKPVKGGVRVLTFGQEQEPLMGGLFTFSRKREDRPINQVAHWTGRRWQPLGLPLPGPLQVLVQLPNGRVLVAGAIKRASKVQRDDSLYTGPSYHEQDQDLGYVAQWDGQAWRQLGGPLRHPVHALRVLPDGQLIVGGGYMAGTGWNGPFGPFSHGRPRPANTSCGYLARWDGAQLHWIDSTLNGPVTDIDVAPNSDVVIGGAFADAGGNPLADHIARYDGHQWHALGSGLNGEVNTVAVDQHGDVYVGGSFTSTGGGRKAVAHFGIYHAPELRAKK